VRPALLLYQGFPDKNIVFSLIFLLTGARVFVKVLAHIPSDKEVRHKPDGGAVASFRF